MYWDRYFVSRVSRQCQWYKYLDEPQFYVIFIALINPCCPCRVLLLLSIFSNSFAIQFRGQSELLNTKKCYTEIQSQIIPYLFNRSILRKCKNSNHVCSCIPISATVSLCCNFDDVCNGRTSAAVSLFNCSIFVYHTAQRSPHNFNNLIVKYN